MFSVILWLWDGYDYAYFLMFISFYGIAENLYTRHKNLKSIQNLAKYSCEVMVNRRENEKSKAKLVTVSSDELVPGDIVVVPDNCLMPCDMILLTGSCIVNESMLTGESVPLIKTCLQPTDDVYNTNNYDFIKKFTLYSGTKVI